MSIEAQRAREALGTRLREIRRGADLTGRALAALTGWQLSKISKIEHGKQAATEADVRLWLRHCQREDALPDLLAAAHNIETLWTEWRRALRPGARQRQLRSIDLYERTRTFYAYNPNIIWGTLQTAEYAETLMQQLADFMGDGPADIEAGVAARMERQQYLYRGDRRFNVILGEQALYTNIGGADVMRGQLDRLLAVMSLARLSLGIIPARSEYKIWPGPMFIMFDDRLVMLETYSAELTITEPNEIAMYGRAYALLQRSAVYGPPARRLITEALTQLR
ncbi:helix-turn-helix domain-containing protein [Nonomuraea angiospora]|uniref:helix-turn-helix domain-containing protein n=1 Tax=Nonomuraea angiospora TaxID=46172 RepID=UPI0029B99CCC|nr:helix-turn-helix transcriptional regulator [Nonomuraea angiospora]MDX3101774.1 helix-turn-helix transcriptional regulator [Nonomuraea angiospora]